MIFQKPLRTLVSSLLGIVLCNCAYPTEPINHPNNRPASLVDQNIKLGMNYNWWRFDPDTIKDCKAHPAAVFRGNWLLPKYEDKSVRDTVKQHLIEMRKSGFTMLKIIVPHSHPEPRRKDGGYLFSTDGSLAKEDKIKLQNFITDIVSAGFDTIEVAYGFFKHGPHKSYKHRAKKMMVQKGDDIEKTNDPMGLEEYWRFIDESTRAIMSVAGKTTLIFDLRLEAACAASNMDAISLMNTKRYVQTLGGRFQTTFGNHWLFSCPHSPPNKVGHHRVDLLLQFLKEGGLRPKYVEFHNYLKSQEDIFSALDDAEAAAKQIDAYVIYGEMLYHSEQQASIIAKWLAQNPDSRVFSLMQWPKQAPSYGCQMNIGPPFTPGPLGNYLHTPN